MIRKLLVLLLVIPVFMMSGCKNTEDYAALEKYQVATYYQAERYSNNRYIIYYYDSTDSNSDTIKEEIISFFQNFTLLEFVVVDTSTIDTEISSFGGYNGEPIIYLVSNNQPYEIYSGTDEIRTFIDTYQNLVLDYNLFTDQQLSQYADILEIDNENYLVYVYGENQDSLFLKDDFLKFAFSKSIEDIYFIDQSVVSTDSTLELDLPVLSETVPYVLLMSNGIYTAEYYQGILDIEDYIEDVGSGDIYTTIAALDYSDFADHIVANYSETLTAELHFEYYYSPYCSHCNSIKTTMLYFFSQLEDIDYLLVNVSATLGIVPIEEFVGTPTLFVVYNGEVVDTYIGSIDIPIFVDAYRNGEIDYSSYQ